MDSNDTYCFSAAGISKPGFLFYTTIDHMASVLQDINSDTTFLCVTRPVLYKRCVYTVYFGVCSDFPLPLGTTHSHSFAWKGSGLWCGWVVWVSCGIRVRVGLGWYGTGYDTTWHCLGSKDKNSYNRAHIWQYSSRCGCRCQQQLEQQHSGIG